MLQRTEGDAPPISVDIQIQAVKRSPHFDLFYYLAQVGQSDMKSDPIRHYIEIGESAGLAPSRTFTPADYLALNPDLAASGINMLAHYELHGRSEGRAIVFESESINLDASRIDNGKPTVVLLLHEATYSGAPILGWNLLRELKLTRNVVVVLRKGGPLTSALKDYASAIIIVDSPRISDNPLELDRLASRIVALYRPTYVVANSIETRLFAVALRKQQVPIVTLVHEFVTHTPPYALTQLYKQSDAIVFPAKLVFKSSLERYEIVSQRHVHILPQGVSEIPRLKTGENSEVQERQVASQYEVELASPLTNPSPFTVIGLGAIDLRKGVDLFIAAATALKERGREARFIWVGERVHPPHHQYNVFVDEQLQRSGVTTRVHLCGPVDNLQPVYAAADAIFISSRLDPLPNVGIDAARHGVPLLCFDDATGFAELLSGDPDTDWLVAPYMDIGAIADRLVRLIDEPMARKAAADAMLRMAELNFNMMRYTRRLDEIGLAAATRLASIEAQAATLQPQDAFNADLYFGRGKAVDLAREDAVLQYLAETAHVNFSGDAAWGEHERRPMPGFHSLMYGRLNPEFPRDGSLNPLVHYHRSGRPAGPWVHDVLTLADDMEPWSARKGEQRVALHGHFHYTDNFSEFLAGLEANASNVDLFLTTTTTESADILADYASNYSRGRLEISVSENLGRDIRPFINLLKGPLADYDLVGHLHGKRSVHTLDYDKDLGNRWRIFLWQHLLGPATSAMDQILKFFWARPDIGLVFPENDYLVGWELNKALAQELAPRLGLNDLPEHIEFPVGTMFWARPKAIYGLVEAGFDLSEYPAEPLPIDGTMLHVLERVLPLLTERNGYKIATTYYPRFTR